MHKFTLELLFHIIGIGSASGIVYKDNSVFMIADNSTYLYDYRIKEKELHKIRLFPGSQENIEKKEKPDFEAITQKGSKLFLFGSGSTDKRKRLLGFDLNTKNLTEKDLTELYENLKEKAKITENDLNIEGALFYNKALYLLQRGNGAKAKNGIFIIDDAREDNIYVPILLPKIKNVAATFTDGMLVNDKIYFLASAENSVSTYEDGEILGTMIGSIDIATMVVTFTQVISEKNKFEGLTLYENKDGKLTFLLCEDTDTDATASDIFKLTIEQ